MGRQFLNCSSLFSPNFSQLLCENFHIISISTDPIIVLPTGYGPWEIRGKSVSLSPSMISCWLVAFTPSQRAVFLSILHGPLHFFLVLVVIHHDEIFSLVIFLGLSLLSPSPFDSCYNYPTARLRPTDLTCLPQVWSKPGVREQWRAGTQTGVTTTLRAVSLCSCWPREGFTSLSHSSPTSASGHHLNNIKSSKKWMWYVFSFI